MQIKGPSYLPEQLITNNQGSMSNVFWFTSGKQDLVMEKMANSHWVPGMDGKQLKNTGSESWSKL